MTPDPEVVYRLAYAGAWPDVLAFVHAHHAALRHDAPLATAAARALDAFFTHLDAVGAAACRSEVEMLFLLHRGGLYLLPPAQFAAVAAALAGLHAGDPETAVAYAACCPDHPACAAVLARYAPPPRHRHPTAEAVTVTPAGPAHALRTPFNSQQEADFFRAVREVLPLYVAFPNVALRTVVHYDAVAESLTPAERRFFFTALVDCVVFDPATLAPCFFFELDSPLHDAPEQQVRDRRKDRILSLAGARLYRLRRPTAGTSFVAALRAVLTAEAAGRIF